MKSVLFASPNLKMILAGAALIVVIQHMIAPEQSDSLLTCQAGAASLEQMVEVSYEQPTAENYDSISGALLRKGDLKGALFYLRKADLAAEVER